MCSITTSSYFKPARPTASASRASAPGPHRSPARRNSRSGATKSRFSIATSFPAASIPTASRPTKRAQPIPFAKPIWSKQLGVKFQQNIEIGRDVSFEDLEQQFDAIFIGVGLGETWDLKLPGEDLHGVYGAIEFIEKTKVQPLQEVEVGRRVACIGAGNTAIDVVTAARRLGAETVYLIYRRGEPEMPAFAYEYQLAKQDAVSFLWQTQPVRVLGTNGVVTGLECVRTQLGPPDAKGRRTSGTGCRARNLRSMSTWSCAPWGKNPLPDFLRAVKGLEINANGTVKINERHQTGHAKYFAGGDCTNGGKEVVDAVAEGHGRGARPGRLARLAAIVTRRSAAEVRDG